ncbi:conserved hypothetical protein [Tenacibaculum maritimum]|uniref:hypothetical protein n=1 Tax=Tenacibaculum maritimum TaxID=107401 RepID=UPI0012E60701|nr:hypothetical protein [Tenacibaculum maritimum]MCD9582306.1 hypothetical protein [Tenacibaculum maritimum]MCD9636688.1 hypothetical protein [Tenacibaculum maritimum]CAA0144796.1 conserved hypothetical protein [Tenacibaculum maritimum]CAA0192817.1 conserved hypothetical protein [Tenacibaculum maritimum]
MNDLRTIYTVKGRNFPVIWEFYYDLDGVLREYKLIDGEPSEKLRNWMFHPVRFPHFEHTMNSWKAIKNIEIIIGQPDLSFDSFWKEYNHKVGKLPAEKAFKRLSKVDKLKAFKSIKPYNGYLRRKGIEKAYAQKYLNQRKFDDEFNSIH